MKGNLVLGVVGGQIACKEGVGLTLQHCECSAMCIAPWQLSCLPSCQLPSLVINSESLSMPAPCVVLCTSVCL